MKLNQKAFAPNYPYKQPFLYSRKYRKFIAFLFILLSAGFFIFGGVGFLSNYQMSQHMGVAQGVVELDSVQQDASYSPNNRRASKIMKYQVVFFDEQGTKVVIPYPRASLGEKVDMVYDKHNPFYAFVGTEIPKSLNWKYGASLFFGVIFMVLGLRALRKNKKWRRIDFRGNTLNQ